MKLSIFHNTWFAESRLDLQTVCRFIAYFVHIRPPRFTFLERELEISNHIIVDWSSFCSEEIYQCSFLCFCYYKFLLLFVYFFGSCVFNG